MKVIDLPIEKRVWNQSFEALIFICKWNTFFINAGEKSTIQIGPPFIQQIGKQKKSTDCVVHKNLFTSIKQNWNDEA